jgi:hypothetical protein
MNTQPDFEELLRLFENKRASSRPQDLADLEKLGD